jgi:hypothetical protein
MSSDKMRELTEEFRNVVVGESNLADTVIPTVVFLIVNGFLGFEFAMWSSLLMALLITALRLRRRQPLQYAIAGVGSVLFAVAISRVTGRAEGYFLPAIANGALVFIVTLASVLVGRPLVAWTSYFARRWPLDWYWHPKVRPAYTEVTLVWAVVFGLRLWLQVILFRANEPERFAAFTVIGGWPTTIALLVLTYLYGSWRLKALGGPSVEEFKANTRPPWKGQLRGF